MPFWPYCFGCTVLPFATKFAVPVYLSRFKVCSPCIGVVYFELFGIISCTVFQDVWSQTRTLSYVRSGGGTKIRCVRLARGCTRGGSATSTTSSATSSRRSFSGRCSARARTPQKHSARYAPAMEIVTQRSSKSSCKTDDGD